MPASTLIRVPVELHARLKELAHLRRATMVDLVHGIVREAEASGELTADASTFGITLDLDRSPPRIVLTTEGQPLADLTPADTRELADKLELVAKRGGSQYVAQERWQTMISRVGTGIVLERQDPLPDASAPVIRRSLNSAFAIELASRLRAAAPTQ